MYAYLLNTSSLHKICYGCAGGLTNAPLFREDANEKVVHDCVKVLVDCRRGVLHKRVPNIVHRTLHVGIRVEPGSELVTLKEP
jgi:hypothetical protein